jgi:hypothetical protein
MWTNRISAYFETADDEQRAETSMLQKGPNTANPIAPPENFAPIPQGLLQGLSPQQLAWQQDLYRSAYQSALAAQAAERLRRAERN